MQTYPGNGVNEASAPVAPLPAVIEMEIGGRLGGESPCTGRATPATHDPQSSPRISC